jgi:RAQPRD family integrative conjugative element protein
MGPINCTPRWRLLAVLLAASLLPIWTQQPAIASDNIVLEREQLAALARQLDLIDRLAEHAANAAPHERARYHFDYTRLRADLKRIRSGLQDYLVPQRAQPRDPVALIGDYVQRDPNDGKPSP